MAPKQRNTSQAGRRQHPQFLAPGDQPHYVLSPDLVVAPESRMGEADTSWVMTTYPKSGASVRLFCLPSAGYGAAMYRLWGRELPDDIEVCAVTLPGRETLLRHEPLRDLRDLADKTALQVEAHIDGPYAIFGHSMGSWLAFETVRCLRAKALPLPVHLFASGRRAPNVSTRQPPIHQLDDAALLREIQLRYGPIPAAVLNEPDLLALMVPALRADLTALETYEYVEEAPLSQPISCFSGIDDQVTEDDLTAWRALTSGEFFVRLFPGGHFFLKEASQDAVLAEIRKQLLG